MKTKVVIADDHYFFRNAVKLNLELQDRYEVCAAVADGSQALTALNEHKPDVLLLDIEMPNLNGWQVLEILKEENRAVHTLVFSCFDNNSTVTRALQLGAKGLLSKDADAEELCVAIDEVASNRIYAKAHIVQNLFNHKTPKPNSVSGFHFTEDEIELLKLLCTENGNIAIAKKMLKSEKAIEAIKTNLLKRSGCKNMYGALALAISTGIVFPDTGQTYPI